VRKEERFSLERGTVLCAPSQSFLINIFAVTDVIDSNRAAFRIDFIEDSVVTNAKTVAGSRTP
jgi:hypothetical protein